MDEIKICIAGDFCPIGRNEELFIGRDFTALQEIRSEIKEADFRIVNLEAPLTDADLPIKKTGPNIKASPKTVYALQYLNINLVTMANNHILDFGQAGIQDTLNLCHDNHIQTVGAGLNLAAARKAHTVLLKGRRIAVLNFAENEFCAATSDTAGASTVNPISNFYDIAAAKKENDLVIVIAHGGREHYQLPTPQQRERFRFYADAGADLVVGHHTHCFSGYEIYNGKPIFYSLGNFIFDYKKKYQKGKWTEGYAVMFSIADEISFDLIPFKQGREENPALTLMNEEEKVLFFKQIADLNRAITDDSLFAQEWEKYLSSQDLNYTGMVTIQNKYVRAAVNKKLLPYYPLHSREHLLLILNLLRCETHREITVDILSKKLENER
ncbi:CapA family protein [Chryseobacterium sp. HSC-36S06]|uniref:CapA family protein n=1 Tax=Chryseobacterium sp. HSC-36S06 TaxID=2910970 RepID=UPI00209FE44F|nr:CapA family protein [Chryseobacterium sp. HSC-36S06]MCP2037684.1 poly-gamma-glutamate synthesis protein (capsule biosynthesis protein) [Chryseobacterium sp. HSC-36S06]